jgi:hypothetical protein
MKHFVVTRFGLGIREEAWYRAKMEVFKRTAFASLNCQDSQQFHWLICIDKCAPSWFKNSLMAMCPPHFLIAELDLETIEISTIGGFHWVFMAAAKAVGLSKYISNPDEYIITSLIDDDDIWRNNTVSLVASHFKNCLDRLIAEEGERPYLLSPSSGAVLSFTHGNIIDMDRGIYRSVTEAFHSMSVFVLSRFRAGISACSCRHRSWPEFARVLNFETLLIDTDESMWGYLRHAHAMRSSEQWSNRQRLPLSDLFEDLVHFGVHPESLCLQNADTALLVGVEAEAKTRLIRQYSDAARRYLQEQC